MPTFSLHHLLCGWRLAPPGSPSPLSCWRSSSKAAPAGRASWAAAAWAAAGAAGLGTFLPILEPILVSVLQWEEQG